MPSKRKNITVQQSFSKKSTKTTNTSGRKANKLSQSPRDAATGVVEDNSKTGLITSLQILDPLLQFLTRGTGRTLVPLPSLRAIIPPNKLSILNDFPDLHRRGVLYIECSGIAFQERDTLQYEQSGCLFGIGNHIDDAQVIVGFPPPLKTDLSSGDYGSDQDLKNIVERRKSLDKKNSNLHGSTKAAAKRRLAALKRSIKQDRSTSARGNNKGSPNDEKQHVPVTSKTNDEPTISRGLCPEFIAGVVNKNKYQRSSVVDHGQRIRTNFNENIGEETSSTEALSALDELQDLLEHGVNYGGAAKNDNCADMLKESNGSNNRKDASNALHGKEEKFVSQFILKNQAAFSGSHRARIARNSYLSEDMRHRIPSELADVMKLHLYKGAEKNLTGENFGDERNEKNSQRRLKLYSHQATAIEAVLRGIHTLVCTGTGSGKSLCFLLPILAEVMKRDLKHNSKGVVENNSAKSVGDLDGCTALLMFPTKALAQDQLSKLLKIVKSHPLLEKHVRPGVIDGDTPHSQRPSIAKHCNIILSNPDTLHAAILPQWKGIYKELLSQMKFVVVDELHIYEGAFGAHVALVLSRLSRVCCIAKIISNTTQELTLPVFVGCSATISHPEEHFRLLCPIPSDNPVRILTQEEDGSPCQSKHFFVWNPPLVDTEGKRSNQIVLQSPKSSKSKEIAASNKNCGSRFNKKSNNKTNKKLKYSESLLDSSSNEIGDEHHQIIRRTHAADETAHVLAQAVKVGIRCIAFCKTRMLAEWVYDSCASALQSDSATTGLISRLEVYRGGYSTSIRRDIENRLFHNELFGVVATSALELGVDIGGIDLTLHCGYPGSISSLMQQAGRAGRGGVSNMSSFSIMICFSSPSEQHLWKLPKGLLSRGLDAPPSVPMNTGIVEGHLLCAGEEFPLVGCCSVNALLHPAQDTIGKQKMLSDHDLFGSEAVYTEAVENMLERGHLWQEDINKFNNVASLTTHPSVKKPWMQVSLRSIEPINYSIVDMSHPRQGGRNDGIHDKAAVMDTIPYSRVFYHAYPGAIIMHRGNRYKIQSISLPPTFANSSIGYRYDNSDLGAFAVPTNARYSTRPLSINHFTVIKQFHLVEIPKNVNTNEAVKLPCNIVTKQRKETDNDESISFYPELASGCLAGSGVVNVKKTVHGYKKLSLVNRTELSRTEISVPPMEYDTNALWIDAEASILNEVMTDYNAGVHALSHAIVAVAPLFVPCTSSDIDCDHSRVGCTRVLLFDTRAGGAGTCTQLWKHFFKPSGVLDAAIDLLSECPSCELGSYKGGCPGCIQAIPCVNFQSDLNRETGLQIGRRMLARLQKTTLYKNICSVHNDTKLEEQESPTHIKRLKALHKASDLVSARKRNIVVGRPTWPTDEVTKTMIDD